MVDDFILVINQKKLRSRMKSLRKFYKDIEMYGKSDIERGEILMHLDYFSRIVVELGKRYGTDLMINDGLAHIKNYRNELGKVEPDPNVMNQAYLGLRNVLFALLPPM